MRYAGTKRVIYTKDKVRKLAERRKTATAKVDGVSDEQYQARLGKLQAAGHMKIRGFNGFSVDTSEYKDQTGKDMIKNKTTISMVSLQYKDLGDQPHIMGYLESTSSVDGTPYKLKGWFNEDGTIRLELVK